MLIGLGVSTMKQLLGITALLVVLATPVEGTHLPQTEPDSSLSPQRADLAVSFAQCPGMAVVMSTG